MNFDLHDTTIFLMVSGSHAYGMATSTSDVDLRGVCVAPMSQRLGYQFNFEQYQGPLMQDSLMCIPARARFPGESFNDTTIYDIVKAVKLIADNNPNMMELLWGRDEDILRIWPIWEAFREIRDSFLSQRCKYTFMGYAHAQYKKIESHRKWLREPLLEKPKRTDFGLQEVEELPPAALHQINQELKAKISSWGIEDLLSGATQDVLREKMKEFWTATLQCTNEDLPEQMYQLAEKALSLPEKLTEKLQAERGFRTALNKWNSFQKWKTERNPARAELEAKHGFDTKHAAHLIRLSRMAVEILRDKRLNVFREDAEELLKIRRGEWSFEKLEEEFRTLETQVTELSKTTTLPRSPDHALINQTLVSVLTK